MKTNYLFPIKKISAFSPVFSRITGIKPAEPKFTDFPRIFNFLKRPLNHHFEFVASPGDLIKFGDRSFAIVTRVVSKKDGLYDALFPTKDKTSYTLKKTQTELPITLAGASLQVPVNCRAVTLENVKIILFQLNELSQKLFDERTIKPFSSPLVIVGFMQLDGKIKELLPLSPIVSNPVHPNLVRFTLNWNLLYPAEQKNSLPLEITGVNSPEREILNPSVVSILVKAIWRANLIYKRPFLLNKILISGGKQ